MSQENIKQVRIKFRVDTIDNWKDTNPVLLEREIGYEKETGKYKIGNDISTWNELPYSSVGNKGATIEQINDLISITNDKVDKISGKTLSSNDFTNDYKNKIDNTEHLIDEKIAALIDSAPEALDTLNELAKALGNDPNFATTILNKLSQKANVEYVDNLFNSIINGEEVYY